MTVVLTKTRSNGQRVRRFPFGPVQEAVSRRTGLPLHQQGCPCLGGRDDCCSARFLAQYLHTSERQIHRWRNGWGLTAVAADRLATELGLRIEDLWGEE